jgi:hypothetical protein
VVHYHGATEAEEQEYSSGIKLDGKHNEDDQLEKGSEAEHIEVTAGRTTTQEVFVLRSVVNQLLVHASTYTPIIYYNHTFVRYTLATSRY